MKKMKILAVLLLISKISLGTNSSCIQKYETKPTISHSMSERLAIYLQKTGNDSYNFFPISITDFLKAEYSDIISRFETQIELLQAKGDKNPLVSNLLIYSAAEKKMDNKIKDVEKNIDPNFVQKILSWKKSREAKLQQLVKEANECKGRLNACAFDLKQAISKTIRDLSELSNLVSTLESYKGEYSNLVSALESDPRGFGIDQNAFNSALPLLNAHDVEVSNMISTLKRIASLNEEKLIMAKLKDNDLSETDQRIKELRAEGVENLNVSGISPASFYNVTSPANASTGRAISQQIQDLRVKTQRFWERSKKTAAALVLATSALGGIGYGTYEAAQPSQIEMKMAIEKPELIAVIRRANGYSDHRRDELIREAYFGNFQNMSAVEVDFLRKGIYNKDVDANILTHYLNYSKNKPTAEYKQKLESQMEKKYPEFMDSLHVAEKIANYSKRCDTLVSLFNSNYTRFSFEEVEYLASKAYNLEWSDYVLLQYSKYKIPLR